MATKLTDEQREQIESTGYGITGKVGGRNLQTYYTPDGREVRLEPSLRNYVRKDIEGKIVGSGTRDANLDKGLLPYLLPDGMRQLECPYCRKWHRTQEEVDQCGIKTKADADKWEKIARKESQKAPEDRLSSLENKVDRLTDMFSKVLDRMEGNNG